MGAYGAGDMCRALALAPRYAVGGLTGRLQLFFRMADGLSGAGEACAVCHCRWVGVVCPLVSRARVQCRMW